MSDEYGRCSTNLKTYRFLNFLLENSKELFYLFGNIFYGQEEEAQTTIAGGCRQ